MRRPERPSLSRILLLSLAAWPAVPCPARDPGPLPGDELSSVAVLDFRVIGDRIDAAIGEALPAVLRSALVRDNRSQRLRVIERAELVTILKEQDLQLTDIVDPASAVEVGRLAGVDRLVLGSVARVGSTYTATCRMVDVSTGEAAGAEEFVLSTLDDYPRLGRLMAALVAEHPIGEDSVARSPTLTESFDGQSCRLVLDSSTHAGNGTSLKDGRYLMRQSSPGDRYSWISEVDEAFYVQADLAQVAGPTDGGSGLVWGARGAGDYLSVLLTGGRGLLLERRQGGTTSTPLLQLQEWPVLHAPPDSNRIRIESWDDRHRVFVNGVCVDDFYEPGYRTGKVGLRVSGSPTAASALYAVDNLIAGPLDLAQAGIEADAGSEAPPRTAKRPGAPPVRVSRTRPVLRSSAPSVTIRQVRVTRQVIRKSAGVEVHVEFDAHNLRGARLRAVAYFENAETGRPLRDRDGRFHTGQDLVAVGRSIAPKHRLSSYSDLTLFIPISQLHLPDGRATRVHCHVIIWDESRKPFRKLDQSRKVAFTIRG